MQVPVLILSENTRGAFLMMGSMAAFTVNDTFIKLVAGELPLFQAIFIRGVVTSLLLLSLGLASGRLRWRISSHDRRLVGLRTLAELGATTFFLTALFHMPLANVTAILQALPLAITLAGAVFLKESVGWRRYGAIAIGFFGVMLIIRPGSAGFDAFSIYALVAVAFVVVRDLTTRRLSRDVPSLTVALVTALAVTTMGAVVTMFADWQPVSLANMLSLGAAAIFIVAGYTLAVMVMRVGEIGFVAAFRYTSLIWAILLGLLVFREFPAAPTLLGGMIVVLTGIYAIYRERIAHRPKP